MQCVLSFDKQRCVERCTALRRDTSINLVFMSFLKPFKALVAALALATIFTACIREEALNAEADITAFRLDGNLLIREPVITNDEVKLYINGWEDRSKLAPRFELTPGATISPASGTERDFTAPQTYVVTSQDGQWKKTYTVTFISNDVPTEYHFEGLDYYVYKNEGTGEEFKKFEKLYEQLADGSKIEWNSGNAGFMITNADASPKDYPTMQDDEGYVGKCAKLVTRSTGPIGIGFGAPLAAGNLFLGDFQINIINMAKSTHFGLPYRHKPIAISGFYKYQPGKDFTDKTNTVLPNERDTFDIYAVMYESTKDVPYLDGTNIKTHPNIVMIAQVKDRKATDQWTRFVMPFESVEGRTLDPEKLRSGKYNLAIVMSSSQGGAFFRGAVGSTLWVDEMQLFHE